MTSFLDLYEGRPSSRRSLPLFKKIDEQSTFAKQFVPVSYPSGGGILDGWLTELNPGRVDGHVLILAGS